MNRDNDYIPRQFQRDREYEAAWESDDVRKWLASLSPQKRRELEAEGLLKPMLAKHGNGMSECDLADSPLASEEPDIIDQIEPENGHHSNEDDRGGGYSAKTGQNGRQDVEERIMDVLRRFLAEVVSQKNATLTLECLAIACGLNLVDGDSMQDVARRHGISRAAVSKRCVDITEKLNLSPSRAMRSKEARKSYRGVQKNLRKRHERTRHPHPQSHPAPKRNHVRR